MLAIVLAVPTFLLLALTTLGRLPTFQWWARACEFPRLQLATLALLTGIAWLFADPQWRTWGLAGCAIVIAVQAYRILPWTWLWPIQVKKAVPGMEERCVTLLIANVLTPNRNAKGLIDQILAQDPDIVLTLESDQWWQDQLDAALEAGWPHTLKVPLDNLYGMHLYSRLPLEEAKIEWLIQDDIPSFHMWVALPCGDQVRLHTLHPRPPAPNESEESLWRDAELLLVGKHIHQSEEPTLLAGDLNDVAWSRTTRRFCRVSGMLDPRRGRGMFSTFHASYPWLRWPLDHLFVSEHFTLNHMQRLKPFGSDHLPILAKVCFCPSRADEHEPPEADGDDREKARDTIHEAKRRDQDD